MENVFSLLVRESLGLPIVIRGEEVNCHQGRAFKSKPFSFVQVIFRMAEANIIEQSIKQNP